MAPERSSTASEQDYLEDNIATVAFHLGQPGARLTVTNEILGLTVCGLIVEPGEVLKEVSRRVLRPAQLQPEPASWVIYAPNGNVRLWSQTREVAEAYAAARDLTCVPLYASAVPSTHTNTVADSTGEKTGTHGASKGTGDHSRDGGIPVSRCFPGECGGGE